MLATTDDILQGTGGLWVYEVEPGTWRQLTDKGASWMALSPEGTRIAILHHTHSARELDAEIFSKDPEVSMEALRKLSEVELLIFELERE